MVSDDAKWVVCKFGGTSVSSSKTWKVITDHMRKLTQDGFKVCLVVSAVSQVTNHLEKVLAGLLKETSKDNDGDLSEDTTRALEWIVERHVRHCEELGVPESSVTPFLDEVQRLVDGIRLTGDPASFRLCGRMMTFGELMSSHIGLRVLERDLSDLRIGLVDARKVLISSRRDDDTAGSQNDEDKFLNADVVPSSLDLDFASKISMEEDDCSLSSGAIDQRAKFFVDRDVVITQGFIASTTDGQPCVLGRGGSDTSGSHFAALLNATRLEIWTDVDGMFSADPRHVPNAKLIEELSYREAQELAAMGAKVLHPRCLGPASWARVPVEIHNTMNLKGRHTRIVAPEALTSNQESKVMAITKRSGQVLITISTLDMWGTSGFLSRVFAPFEKFDISVDLIATSQYAVSMTLDYIPGGITGEPFRLLKRALQRQGNVHVEPNCTVVSVVGRKLRAVLHGIAGAFMELEGFNVLLLSESTEDLNMSFVLAESARSADELVLSLHKVLLEGVKPSEERRIVPPSSAPSESNVRKPRTPSFSSPSLGPVRVAINTAMLQSNLLGQYNWIEEELKNYDNEPTPFAIVDLETVKRCATRVETFSLSWSSQPAVLRAVFEANPKIVFLCRTFRQVQELCSIVGPGPNVCITASSETISNWPTNANKVNNPSSEEISRFNFVFAEARAIVTSIIDFDSNSGAASVDMWFQARNGQRISIHSDISEDITKVQALSLHEDVMDTLWTFSSEEEKNTSPPQERKSNTSRIVLSGVPAVPISTKTLSPVQDFVRFIF